MEALSAARAFLAELQIGAYVATIAGAVITYFLYQFIAIHNSPLRKLNFPGPPLSKYTGLRIDLQDLVGYRHREMYETHLKYGPVVQLGPKELSFMTPRACREIYTGPNALPISDLYKRFGDRDNGMMFVSPEPKHRQKRAKIVHVFSKPSIATLEPILHQYSIKLLAKIEEHKGKPFDLLFWDRMLNMDVAGELFFSKPFGALDGSSEAKEYTHMIDFCFINFLLKDIAKPLLTLLKASKSFLPKALKDVAVSGDYVANHAKQTLATYVRENGRGDTGRRNLLTKLLAADLPDPEIEVEIFGMTFAAVDTTATVMTYIMYELSCHPEWQDKLRSELLAAKLDDKGYAISELYKLPILGAIIDETLRLHPPAIAGMPRITPPEGATIDGQFVPGNVFVSVSAFVSQRNPEIFPEPNKFDPTRWLSGKYDTQEVQDAMILWGKGGRECLGKQLASNNLRVMVSRILSKLRVKVASEQTHDDMIHTDHLVLIPKGMKCMLIFNDI